MSTTADPRSVAFDILARHQSDEAAEVLLQALECDDDQARKLAAATVVQQRGQQSILEIIRRVDSLDDEACKEFSRSPEQFRVALEQALSKSDEETRKAAITFICRTGNFDQFATLLDELESADSPDHKAVSATVEKLATQLDERFRSNDESILPGLDGTALRTHRATVLSELDSRTKHFDELSSAATIVRLILIVGGPEDEAVRNVLTKRGDACRDAASKLLTEDSHPALLNLLSDFLAYHAPPACTLEVIRTRSDFDFVVHLLTRLPRQPSGYLALNLSRLHELAWLQNPMELVERLPESVHDRLVGVVNHAPLDDETKIKLKTWIIRRSGAAGREAASDVLKIIPQEEASRILHDALKDPDAKVEAWATRRLRAQKLPDTFEELLKRLDRKLDVVRNAARDELFSFDLNYLMKILSKLSPAQAQLCGQALLKINPGAPEELSQEIEHPFRRRRLRAIEAAEAIGFVDKVSPALLRKLEDPEASVRCAAIQALGRHLTPEVAKAIRQLTNDPNRQVRSIAEEVITRSTAQLKSVAKELLTSS